MIFWILVAVLTAAITFWVTRPLLKTEQDAFEPVAADIAVYKDQLAEIDADAARGQISGAEADAARTEVARRLLRLPQGQGGEAAQNKQPLKLLHTATTLALPLIALALYLAYGNPSMPGVPFKERLAAAPEKSTAGDLIAKVEERLRQEPNDGKGWDVIAPVYVAQGRYQDAVDAYANAMRILGETPKRLEGLAMADIRAANGLVTEKARKAFARTLEMDATRIDPKLWLALAKEQDGKLAEAAAEYKALIASASEDAPWRKAVEERLAAIEGGGGPEDSSGKPSEPAPAASGPAAAGVAGLAPEQRAMVDKMVAGLATRLKENGNDLEGWLKLMRSLKVLGRDAEAAAALGDAKKQFAADGKALEAIDGLAKSLGMGS